MQSPTPLDALEETARLRSLPMAVESTADAAEINYVRICHTMEVVPKRHLGGMCRSTYHPTRVCLFSCLRFRYINAVLPSAPKALELRFPRNASV